MGGGDRCAVYYFDNDRQLKDKRVRDYKFDVTSDFLDA